MTATPTLPASLAAILATHGIEPTTDALLREFERRGKPMSFDGECFSSTYWWSIRLAVPYPAPRMVQFRERSLLAALAAAFAALVGEEKPPRDDSAFLGPPVTTLRPGVRRLAGPPQTTLRPDVKRKDP